MKKNFFPLSFLLLLLYLCACNNSDTGKTTQNKSQTNPEVKSVFINGDSLHYIDIGKGEPVVFVHGALGDYRTWRAQVDSFAKNYRVIAYSGSQLAVRLLHTFVFANTRKEKLESHHLPRGR